MVTGVGFEPTPPKRLVPKTSALDHSAIQPFDMITKTNKLHPPGIEPGTYCVLGSRHNQLDHSSLKASSVGLEPTISRFVVSRLIQLGHEDRSMNAVRRITKECLEWGSNPRILSNT